MKFIATIEFDVDDATAEFMGPGPVASAIASKLSTLLDNVAPGIVSREAYVTAPNGSRHGLGWSESATSATQKRAQTVPATTVHTTAQKRSAAPVAASKKAAPGPDTPQGKSGLTNREVMAGVKAAKVSKSVLLSPAPARLGRPPFKRDAKGNKIPDGKGGFLKEWEAGSK